MTFLLLFLLVLLHRQIQPVQASFSVALPLLVRSPYISCWLPQINGSNSSMGALNEYHGSTTTSDLSQVGVFSSFNLVSLRLLSSFQNYSQDIFVRVDGTAYSILGEPANSFVGVQGNVSDANVTNRVVTPTQITLTAQAGPIEVNVTFLNPVEVRSKAFNSLVLDSLGHFSQTIGSGNQYHSHTSPLRQTRLIVQLIKWKCIPTLVHVCKIVFGSIAYLLKIVDWAPGENIASDFMVWNVISNDEAIYHTVTYLEPVLFSEDSYQAGWGTFYYATKAVRIFYSFHLVAHSRWI